AIQRIEIQSEQNQQYALVTRETDEGSETLNLPLPALVTAAEKLNEGIWPDEHAIQAASEQHERYQVLQASDLPIDPAQLGQSGSPTWVTSVEPDKYTRAGHVISEDDPARAVELLLAELSEQGLLTRPAANNASAALSPEQSSSQSTPTTTPLDAYRAQTSSQLTPAAAQPREPLSGKAVWVLAELSEHGVRRVTLELLGKGQELAKQLQGELAAVLIGGSDVEKHATTLAAYGATKIYLASDPALAQYTTDGYSAVLAQAIQRYQPVVILVGSTANGRDLAPRVAARLGLGLTGDCIDLGLDEQQRLVQYKPAFGNQIISAILSRTSPAMATLRPGMLQAAQPDAKRVCTIEHLPVEDIAAHIRTRIISQQSEETGVEKLESAHIVIGVGMGVGEPANYTQVHRLAELLDAAIGATRNVADQSWLPKHTQIGLTGRAVAPRLYFALGIRGAPEHIAGIRKAGYVV
ncbi:MAG: FAD-binding protein, partial [Ktedonobacteraceae bacterium]